MMNPMMNTMNKLIVGTVGAVLILTAQAQAQQVPGRPAVTAAAAPLAADQAKIDWQIKAGTELMRVPLNKMVSVRVPADARVIIGNPDIVNIVGPEESGRTQVYFLGQAVGSTSVFFEDGDGNILFHGDIQVDVDVTGIQSAISELMPEEKIKISSQRNGVFLKGFVRSAVASTQAVDIARRFVPDNLNIINNLEVLGSRQVIMQVRVSEMERTLMKQLGVEIDYTGTNGIFNLSTALQTFSGFPTGLATGSILPSVTGFNSVAFRALEENGLTKTLAEPSLTAISGETATFLAGGTFPMQTSVDQNNNATYTQEPFGIRLNFTPTVMDKGQISLAIATEVSAVVSYGTLYGTTKNRTETVVDLPSGGSLIIAGLIKNVQANTIDGVPGLKDLPILGALFRSQAFRNNETELVVTVTAYLAEPVGNDARLALPSDGFIAASDIDLYLLGALHKKYTKTPLPPYATPLVGPYGYIME